MKKIRFLSALLILSLCFSLTPLISNKEVVFADEPTQKTTVSTGIFLPTSYLQYYKLDNPFAICRYVSEEEDFVAISHKDAIVVYSNEKFEQLPLNLDEKSVSVLQRYKNHLLFLYKSTIHTIDITGFQSDDWVPVPKDTGIICNNSFSVNGDYLVRHDSNYIYKHKITSDLSGGFAIDEGVSVDEDLTAMVLLSGNGDIYYSKVDANGIYKWDGTSKSVFFADAQNVSALTESDDGKTIYYSCPDGVYGIDVTTKEVFTVCKSSPLTSDADLGNLYSPRGICYLGDKLWVVDNSINAVQEIDLKTNEFTEFAITTNSQAINRLSENVQDIAVDKDKIYALDKDRIVVINGVNGGERTYNRINLPSRVDKFAAGDGYICYSNDNTINICKLTQNEDDPNILDVSNVLSATFPEDAPINDVSFSEGIFYVARSLTLSDNLQHPVIYTIDLSKEELKLEQILSNETPKGNAVQVVADVFGAVYYCSEIDGQYEFYCYDGNEVVLINSFTKTTSIRNLQTDFDGKLYCLLGENQVVCITGEGTTLKTLETSENLGNINPAKSMCLSCDSSVAYFIFEGLILCSTVQSDLDVSTPHTIDIPDGFNLAYDQNQIFANVKDGAKLFEVDAQDLSGEHFKFLGYSEATSSTFDYAVKRLNDKYSILICDGVAAVTRNSDVIQTFTPAETQASRFAIVDFSPYSLPVLQSQYKTDGQIGKFSVVSVTASVNFNGIEYYIVTDGKNVGYIPDTFLVEKIITVDSSETVENAYVYKKGGIKVYDESGNIIGTIEKKTKVEILSYGDKLAIRYGEKIGYIDGDSIVLDSKDEILKAVAIFLAAISICVTAIFFEKRYLFKK